MPSQLSSDEDPGWGITPRVLLLALIPVLRMRGRKDGNALVACRQAFIAFVTALFEFQIILLLVRPTPGQVTNARLAVALLAIGSVTVFVFTPISLRGAPLDCSDEATLATTYRARFFLQIAFAEAAALFGFVGFFITNLWWVYPASLVIALIGFARLAPTQAHLVSGSRRIG